MMRVLRLALVPAAPALLAAACARPDPRPGEVLTLYVESGFHERCGEAYRWLSSADQALRTQDAYCGLYREQMKRSYFPPDRFAFKIRSTAVHKDSATVTAELTSPVIDPALVVAEYRKAQAAGRAGDTAELLKAAARATEEKYGSRLPSTTTVESFILVREKGDWRVFLDFALADRIDPLLDRAEELFKAGKSAEARRAYEDVLALAPDSAFARMRLRRLDAMDYRSRVTLEGVSTKRVSFTDSPLLAAEISGQVRNGGNRPLAQVGVRVQFADKSGRTLGDRMEAVLEISSGAPLPPGASRAFKFSLDDVPPDWAEASASIGAVRLGD